MNKAAICFSGQPRNVEKGFEYINKNLIKPNEDSYWDFDIFVHSWFDKKDIGKTYEKTSGELHGASDPGSSTIEKNILESIYDLYNPRKCLLESQIVFNELNYNTRKSALIKPANSLSKNYSILQSCLLKQNYEKENNFVYDAVIFYRFDFGINSNVLLGTLDLNFVNTSPHGCWRGSGVDVSHAYMNSPLSNKYSIFYEHINECFVNHGVEFSDERLMHKYLDLYNLPYRRLNELGDYFLIRDNIVQK